MAIIIWKNYSDKVVQEVDDAALTPMDFTLRVMNIPKEMKVTDLKEKIIKISDDIQLHNINIVKKFDGRIFTFKKLIDAAKILKDARTIKFRAMKASMLDKSEDEILEIIMNDTWDADGDLEYLAALENFKQKCIECDKIEEEDKQVEGDGYNIDDFENV